ncbi:MAG: carbamate kinase [Candidatus Njordarchaeum guaymaensis]
MMVKIVLALGGNALLKKGQKGTYEEQFNNAKKTAKTICDIIELGYDVVITHGNGPQVGAILLQNEAGIERGIPSMPLDVANAESQALIGYMLQQTIQNELAKRGLMKNVASIITQVIVDKNDPAFQNPTKPIGPYYSESEAKKLMKEKGWVIKKDPRGGWRRVVPSPDPKAIVEADIIKKMSDLGYVIISTGGGGIPVIKTDGGYSGVEAVIDKDLASAIVAKLVKADILMILTDVEYVSLNFNKPNQKPLHTVSLSQLRKYYNDGHFPPGSMGPKVLAMIRFISSGGKKGIIAHLDKAIDALIEKSGTIVLPDDVYNSRKL